MNQFEKSAMKITHRDLFNHAAEDYNFAAIWLVEDLCQKDLDDTLKEHSAAVAEYDAASDKFSANYSWENERALDLAAIKMYEKHIEYLKKHIIYDDFMRG